MRNNNRNATVVPIRQCGGMSMFSRNRSCFTNCLARVHGIYKFLPARRLKPTFAFPTNRTISLLLLPRLSPMVTDSCISYRDIQPIYGESRGDRLISRKKNECTHVLFLLFYVYSLHCSIRVPK